MTRRKGKHSTQRQTPDDDDMQEWPIHGIVGEETHAAYPCNRTRYYEVRWANWVDADDTDTTWITAGGADLSDRPDLVDAWESQQDDKRRRAAKSTVIPIDTLVRSDFHMLPTAWRALGLEERLEDWEERKERRIARGEYDARNWGNFVPGDLSDEDRATRGRRRRRSLSSERERSDSRPREQDIRRPSQRPRLSHAPSDGTSAGPRTAPVASSRQPSQPTNTRKRLAVEIPASSIRIGPPKKRRTSAAPSPAATDDESMDEAPARYRFGPASAFSRKSAQGSTPASSKPNSVPSSSRGGSSAPGPSSLTSRSSRTLVHSSAQDATSISSRTLQATSSASSSTGDLARMSPARKSQPSLRRRPSPDYNSILSALPLENDDGSDYMFGSNSDHGGDSNADDESDGVQEARRRLRALPSRLSEVQGKMAPLASRSTAPNRPSKTSFSRASSSTPRSTQLSRRQKIQADWDELCNLHHAERVMIVNDVDDEEIPPGLENFKYTEFRYKFSAAVPNPSDEAFFVSCECAPNPKSHRRQNLCGDANQCGCQELAQHPEDDGRRQIAYTPQGLFKVTAWRPTLVVECNKKCHCASTRSSCLNRVSQRPRSIPIEVFKTANGRGWGARTDRVTTIPEGKVLGLYTGEVIRRSSIPQMSKLHKSYMFDLDAQENQDSDEGDQDPDRYSVSAYEYGNWTRFVNHSCEPNAMVYSVIFDTIPENRIYYLVFVAKKAILPHTEITIDYSPQDAGKGMKGKEKLPPGSKECMCGARSCRGYLRV